MDRIQLNNQLLEASKRGDLDTVKQLIQEGADVNHTDYRGYTPLIFGSQDEHLEIVKYLVEHGADVNQANNNGSTPLISSRQNGHLEIVKYLLKHETNKLKSVLSQNYLALERGTPQTITAEGKIKSALPRNLLLKSVL